MLNTVAIKSLLSILQIWDICELFRRQKRGPDAAIIEYDE